MTSFNKWINSELEQVFYTPDVPEIFNNESHYVFLADIHMHGQPKHGRISTDDDYQHLGKAFTKFATYGIMLLNSTLEPQTPVYFEVVPNKEAAFIYGDLIEVSPELLIELDYYMGNRLMTKRKKIPVVTRHKQAEVTAWTWLADVDYFTDPKAADKLSPYTRREYLWNTPVIAWGDSIFPITN